MFVKIYLEDKKVENVLRIEGYNESSILMILKKELGYRNKEEIMKKYEGIFSVSFLRSRLVWRTEEEYKDITYKLATLLDNIVLYSVPDSFRNENLLKIYFTATGYRFATSINIEDYQKTLFMYEKKEVFTRWLTEKF